MMSRGLVLFAVSLVLVFSLRKESQIDLETSLIGPPLCDADIVAEVCKKMDQETIDHYGPTPDMDMSVVHAAELSEYLAASLRSINFFLRKIGATNRETDSLLLARHAFSVSCQELCEKTVASIPASRKPPYSDVGCYPAEGDSSSPSCTIDLSPALLQNITFASDDGSNLDAKFNEVYKAEVEPSEKLQQEVEELLNAEKPDKGFTELQTAVALLFRVHPVSYVTEPDEDEWPEGAEIPKRTAEARKAALLERSDSLTELSSADLQVAYRLTAQSRAWLARAMNNVNARLVQRWFKSSDSRTISSVRSAIGYSANVLSNVEYRNGLMCGISSAIVAYVRPFPPLSHKFGFFGPFIIAICPTFYQTTQNFKIRGLVHEAFHHMWSWKWDHAYGKQGCLNLPGSTAMRNADSFSYFVCEAAGSSCP
eukprot:TRINITY_DN1906_c1_g1_i2.p1 TRINITY_DN1906_c1_g1~~TRINITY_DN1906_c1_g1_i2.p1  ORF type:complete len:425 (-),score=69.72 TRINITY_DN1906_c1_g1_i2:175-1449(-)